MGLAFLAILAVFFISSPVLAAIADVGGFLGHALITLQLAGDPLAATEYAVVRMLTLALSFALVWILSGTVFLTLPALFVLGFFASALAALYHMINVIFFASRRKYSVRRYV